MLQLDFNNKENIYEIIDNYKKNNKVYIWGTGSVAAGVKRELDNRNIQIDGFFTNVKEFNCDPRIRNGNIYILDELLSSGEKFSVIVGHSHYELAKSLEKYPNIENVWTLAMIVRPDISMSEEYIKENIHDFTKTYNSLADDISRQNMQDYLNVQLTRSGNSIISHFNDSCTYFNNDIINLNSNEQYLDIGAYNGSSIDEFIKTTNNKFDKIVGLEVMKDECKKLNNRLEDKRIKIVNTGISNHDGFDYFNFNDQSTCLGNEKSGELVSVSTIDSICKKYNISPTIMKMCIGNTILPILEGSTDTLKELPKMIITAGIDTEALIKYVPKIDDIVGNDKYDYYLRYTSAMAECLIFIIKPKEDYKIRRRIL